VLAALILLAADLADHLQPNDAEVSVLPLFGLLLSCFVLLRLLFLSFFSPGFMVPGAGDRHLMADVFRELHGTATEVPGLSVLARDGELTCFVALL